MGPLVLGATGRVGRMLRASGVLTDAVFQSRSPAPDHLVWDILNTPPPDLPDITGVVMLAGGGADDAALALAAARLGADRGVPVLIASSQAVYGPHAGPHSEDGPTDPTGGYARAKRTMEDAVADMPRVTCLRIGNVTGADALSRAMASGPVTLDEIGPDTGPLRAMIGPVTLARALRDLLAQPALPPVLNLAQPDLIDMADMVRAAGVEWTWQEAPATALPRVDLDLSLVQSLITLPPATPETLIAQARACGWSPA